MSASVTEKTKRGPIQFQKFQRFLRGQWRRRFARTSGARDQPTARGQATARVAEVAGLGELALLIHGPASQAAGHDRQMVRQRVWHAVRTAARCTARRRRRR